MVKFGLLIPADEDSNVMIFDHIYCDIGDDQSIVENLSTFSSHMSKLINIIDNDHRLVCTISEQTAVDIMLTHGANASYSYAKKEKTNEFHD